LSPVEKHQKIGVRPPASRAELDIFLKKIGSRPNVRTDRRYLRVACDGIGAKPSANSRGPRRDRPEKKEKKPTLALLDAGEANTSDDDRKHQVRQGRLHLYFAMHMKSVPKPKIYTTNFNSFKQ